jgi:hypothetical protein
MYLSIDEKSALKDIKNVKSRFLPFQNCDQTLDESYQLPPKTEIDFSDSVKKSTKKARKGKTGDWTCETC